VPLNETVMLVTAAAQTRMSSDCFSFLSYKSHKRNFFADIQVICLPYIKTLSRMLRFVSCLFCGLVG
jgi:hypothetical protein